MWHNVQTQDFYYDIMLNYYLSQKLKLLGRDKLNLSNYYF
jgi:hypothetical protein